MFDQTVLGDASEAMGRVRTADGGGGGGGGDPSGNGAAVAVPINFKELVVLTRRGESVVSDVFLELTLTDVCVYCCACVCPSDLFVLFVGIFRRTSQQVNTHNKPVSRNVLFFFLVWAGIFVRACVRACVSVCVHAVSCSLGMHRKHVMKEV